MPVPDDDDFLNQLVTGDEPDDDDDEGDEAEEPDDDDFDDPDDVDVDVEDLAFV
jgi:hypothetical protein